MRVGAGSAEKGEPVASKVAAATAATMQQPNVTPVPVKAPFWYRYRAAVGGLLLLNLGIGGEPNPNPPIASLLSLCFPMVGCFFIFVWIVIVSQASSRFTRILVVKEEMTLML